MFNPEKINASLFYAPLVCIITRSKKDEWLGKAAHKAFIL
jgi:hypothetical protein